MKALWSGEIQKKKIHNPAEPEPIGRRREFSEAARPMNGARLAADACRKMNIMNGNFSCGDYRRLGEIMDTAVCINVSPGLIVITFAESAYCWISPD